MSDVDILYILFSLTTHSTKVVTITPRATVTPGAITSTVKTIKTNTGSVTASTTTDTYTTSKTVTQTNTETETESFSKQNIPLVCSSINNSQPKPQQPAQS